ncbi:FixG Ig-like domain-containing protein [Azospirillum brasilense]|uniref:FixG Ig-like domain-containing protein n=1 Tax=Azospirillum brasilense TaxID=192 RepID=UPI001FFF7676|nr:FixG Ig-like domain-containing protein [Azospirillum brasilense]
MSNMTRAPQGYRLTVSGPRGATVTAAGGNADGAAPVLGAEPDTVQTHRVHVRAPSGAAVAGSTPLTLTLTRLSDGVVHQAETVFLAP